MGYCTYQTQALNRNSTRSSCTSAYYFISNSLPSFKWKIVYEIFECSTQQRGPRPTTKQQMWRQRPASQQRWRNRLPTSHRGWPMLRTHFHFRSTTSLCGFFFVRSMPSGPLSLLRGLQTSAWWLSPRLSASSRAVVLHVQRESTVGLLLVHTVTKFPTVAITKELRYFSNIMSLPVFHVTKVL